MTLVATDAAIVQLPMAVLETFVEWSFIYSFY